jgi:hypothetical protein
MVVVVVVVVNFHTRRMENDCVNAGVFEKSDKSDI